MQDVQRLIALRPPTDPVTGMMYYDTRQAAEYREALQDILNRYGNMEAFQEAARLPDPAAVSGPQLASVDSPGPPGFTATPPVEVTLAEFAQRMMAPGLPINPNAQGPQGAPGGAVPGMPAPMQPGGSTPAMAGVAQNAGLPALTSRRGSGTVQ